MGDFYQKEFKIILLITILLCLILLILLRAQLVLGATEASTIEGLTSLEAGFEKQVYGNILGAPFFFLRVLYVLFDMELVIIIP